MMMPVHVFVSYSRSDAAFVTRLVALLERDGHDVWVDTDDIHGSEEWRASIVRGIRRADVVLLVISSRSMASENVVREMAVAGQEDRRIVPIALEPAELADGIGYDLAGVQQVSFVGRPFADAADDLRAALAPADPTATAVRRRRASVLPSPTRRRTLLTAVAAVLAVLVAGAAYVMLRDRGGEGAEGATPGPSSPGSATSESVGTTIAPGQAAAATATLDADVWFAGYEISVHGASFDPERLEAAVDVTITNVQPATADPLAILGDITVLEWDGHRATSFCACSRLPPGATLTDTLTFAVDEDFALTHAVLAFGQPHQHRALVPLDGSTPSSERPMTLPVSGVIDDGAGTTFTVDRVEVLPARCNGLSSALAYVPGPADEISVVVWGTALTTVTPNVGLGNALLVQPDGTALGSTSLDGVIYVLEPGQPQRDIPVCFTVRTPTSGDHRVVVTAVGVEPAPSGLAFTLVA